MRTCVGCRSAHPAHELVRLAVVDGGVVVDVGRVLPGRGAWLHPTPQCFAAAQRRRAWARAFRVREPLDVSAVQAWVDAPV